MVVRANAAGLVQISKKAVGENKLKPIRTIRNTAFIFPVLLLWVVLICVPPCAGQDTGPATDLGDRWVALVAEFTTGDHARQYIEGVREEALALGLRLEVMDAWNNRNRTARMIDDVTLRNVNGIMISHGAPEPLMPSVRRSLRRGIPIVAFDCEIPLAAVVKKEVKGK